MEKRDHEMISKMQLSNFELKRLYQEHIDIERRLSKFETRSFLTPIEQVELKRLKRKKLRGVDRMMSILSSHQIEDQGAVI